MAVRVRGTTTVRPERSEAPLQKCLSGGDRDGVPANETCVHPACQTALLHDFLVDDVFTYVANRGAWWASAA